MNRYVYQRPQKRVNPLILVRAFGVFLFMIGMSTVVYIFSPLIIWQLTLAPAFADQAITIPIPQRGLLTPIAIKNLLTTGLQSVTGVDYTNASNWFPGYTPQKGAPRVSLYFLSIPRLAIVNAFVSTTDTNLANHLVSLSGTAVPPEKGNTVIFGHSTLPQLFNPKDYKTIFANAYKIQIGDVINVTVNGVAYSYKVFSLTVVDPEDTSVLSQQYDDSYLTLITCTPPGTIWKRLVIKSRLQKLQ